MSVSCSGSTRWHRTGLERPPARVPPAGRASLGATRERSERGGLARPDAGGRSPERAVSSFRLVELSESHVHLEPIVAFKEERGNQAKAMFVEFLRKDDPILRPHGGRHQG